MTRTEYLFGHPPEKYKEHLEPLAKERIADAKALLEIMVPKVVYDPRAQNIFQEELRVRIGEVMEAKALWEKILEDGK